MSEKTRARKIREQLESRLINHIDMRLAAGFTQEQLGGMIGLKTSEVSHAKHRKITISLERLINVLDGAGVSVSVYMDGEECHSK